MINKSKVQRKQNTCDTTNILAFCVARNRMLNNLRSESGFHKLGSKIVKGGYHE
jgi:hypothetical protein